MTVDRLGHDPADGQVSSLGALDHQFGQFRLGLKGDRLGDMRSELAWQIVAPVFGEIQLAIDEGMAQCSHVGEEDADLTVLHLAAGTTILRRDACRVAAPFGKAAFINDEHREDLRGCRRGG